MHFSGFTKTEGSQVPYHILFHEEIFFRENVTSTHIFSALFTKKYANAIRWTSVENTIGILLVDRVWLETLSDGYCITRSNNTIVRGKREKIHLYLTRVYWFCTRKILVLESMLFKLYLTVIEQIQNILQPIFYGTNSECLSKLQTKNPLSPSKTSSNK